MMRQWLGIVTVMALVFVGGKAALEPEPATYKYWLVGVGKNARQHGPDLMGAGGKGVAGYVRAGDLAVVGGDWWHVWGRCPKGAVGCVHLVKGDWDQDLGQVMEMVAECPGGRILYGDEYVLQGWPTARQVAGLRWFSMVVAAVNPGCGIVWGGVNGYHPWTGDTVGWVAEAAELYKAWYGEAPPVVGVQFHSYYWGNYAPGRDWVADTVGFAEEVRRVYGEEAEVWLTEVGSLVGTAEVMEAVEMLPGIAPAVDRYAMFISRDGSGAWGFTALWDGSELTVLGRRFAEVR